MLRTQYRLKKEFRSTDFARNFIDIAGGSYDGHEINDLISAFSEFIIFEIPGESIYSTEDIWKIACRIASSSTSMRSTIITPEIAKRLGEIALKPNVPTDNIYSAVTSIHWKYVFFELYKCIETIYYLPWQFQLKQELGLAVSANQLAKVCKARIQWRAKEDSSIQALFELCQAAIFDDSIRAHDLFRDLDASASQSTFGRRVYKIRNLLVHQQDYDDTAPLDIQDVQWEAVISFMCEIVDDLYSRFSTELNP
ncbi:MAG: hypothetical protein EOP45_18625 [Sphingobacteriaceae bacterium]|nr:MAG: hypothetical protein EOP45_18625 [Sphingobacteriaceae bacterium]